MSEWTLKASCSSAHFVVSLVLVKFGRVTSDFWCVLCMRNPWAVLILPNRNVRRKVWRRASLNRSQVCSPRCRTSSCSCQATDAYQRALQPNLLQKDMEQFIPVALAYASYEKRQVDNQNFAEITVVESAIQAIVQSVDAPSLEVRIDFDSNLLVSKQGDAKFRLEKFLAGAVRILLSFA